jgi:guanine deaminase
MRITGQLLLARDGRCELAPGWIRIADGHISEVQLGEIRRDADWGHANCLVTPGFIDAHVHLPQFDAIGAHGQPLLDWLQSVIFPAEALWNSVDYAAGMTDRAISDLLRAGTTGFAAYSTVHAESTRIALEIASNRGVQAWIGQALMDCGAPAQLIRPARQLIQETADLIAQFPAGGRVAAVITPRFALSCSDQLLTECGVLARQTGALLQTHLSENLAECQAVHERFKKDYVSVYNQFGLLTSKSILGHGIHLSQSEVQQLSDSRSIVAHCPTANSFLRSGTMRLSHLQDNRVRIALGSDIGAGYEISMVRVARAMLEAAATLGDDFPTAAEAFFAITQGNADLLGWSDTGRIHPGALADLVLIEPNCQWRYGGADPLSRVLFSWDDRWIRGVWLRGKAVDGL